MDLQTPTNLDRVLFRVLRKTGKTIAPMMKGVTAGLTQLMARLLSVAVERGEIKEEEAEGLSSYFEMIAQPAFVPNPTKVSVIMRRTACAACGQDLVRNEPVPTDIVVKVQLPSVEEPIEVDVCYGCKSQCDAWLAKHGEDAIPFDMMPARAASLQGAVLRLADELIIESFDAMRAGEEDKALTIGGIAERLRSEVVVAKMEGES